MTAFADLDPQALDAARRLVAIARARYPVVEAWLYGSHARGEARDDSDVDVAIVVEDHMNDVGRARWDLAGDAFDLMLETGRRVSPLPVTMAKWRAPETFSNPFLLHNIRKDGIPL